MPSFSIENVQLGRIKVYQLILSFNYKSKFFAIKFGAINKSQSCFVALFRLIRLK